jgi:allophanate hydrolase subunit 2
MLSEVTIMADIKSTQTRPKFTFLFLAIYPIGGRPTVLRTDADTEQEARLKIECTDFTLIFAAQIRTESPLHFHRIDLDSGRIELMHQRYQASPEVRHV